MSPTRAADPEAQGVAGSTPTSLTHSFMPQELRFEPSAEFVDAPRPVSFEPEPQDLRRPVVLVAATTCWISSARQALAYAEAGFAVEAVCPSGHPLRRLDFVRALHPMDALDPVASLRKAALTCRPDLIGACDERVVARLHALYATSEAGSPLKALIARSLGAPERFADVISRVRVMEAAAEEGVRRPQTAAIACVEDLERRLDEFGLPAVLKSDGSWGGEGVAIVRDQRSAKRAFRRMSRPPSLPVTFKRVMIDHDVQFVAGAFGQPHPQLSLQRYIPGRPANAAVACWRGEVLSTLCVEAVRTAGETGHASVVRTIEHPEMREAARRMVRRLGLSGLCGLDFLLDETGAAWLLELNARATPTAHIAAADGFSQTEALLAKLAGGGRAQRAERPPGEVIALFPQEMARDPKSDFLRLAFHDVPSRHPVLVALALKTVRRARWRRYHRALVRRLQPDPDA